MSKVTELLIKYPAMKYAVTVYENHKAVPSAGIANYSGMPGASGAPERFFAIVGKSADMGNTSHQDYLDYLQYKAAVDEVEGALAVLNDDQQMVIKNKWLRGLTLKQITSMRYCSLDTVKRNHRMGLSMLEDALRFTKVPEIEVHEKACTF